MAWCVVALLTCLLACRKLMGRDVICRAELDGTGLDRDGQEGRGGYHGMTKKKTPHPGEILLWRRHVFAPGSRWLTGGRV
jgi:hypothetical protein